MKSKNIHTQQTSRWLSIGAAGLGLAFSFPPFPFPFVSCVALIPLLRRWYHTEDPRIIYLDFFYAFLILFLITFSWPLRHPFTNTAIASLSGVLLLPMTLALPFALSSVFIQMGKRWGLLACCAFFMSTEWVWAHGPLAMPGALLGHALSNQFYMNQIADVTGVAGLSLWILTINLAGMLLWDGYLKETPPAIQAKTLWMLLAILLVLPPAYSLWRLSSKPPALPGDTSKIALIQPAVPSLNWSDEQDSARVAHLQRITDSLLAPFPDLDLVVWPETAIPLQASTGESTVDHLQNWSESRGFALLSGAILTTEVKPGKTGYTNSAMLLSKNQAPQQYDKNWLVPFAEHVPFEEALESLAYFRVDAGGVPGYSPGKTQPLMQLKSGAFSVLICFESLFGDYARRFVKKGADFLVVISNIGWWGSNMAPAQYLAFSRLRAIESRSYLLINTVTGPALIVDDKGKTVAELPWMEAGVLVATIPHTTRRTFYVRYGDWLGVLSLIVSLLLLTRYLFNLRA